MIETTIADVPAEWQPSAMRSFHAWLIDFFLILFALMATFEVELSGPGGGQWIHLEVVLLGFFVYEPVLTGLSATLGQRLVGIRVRGIDDGEPIGLGRAYRRLFFRMFSRTIPHVEFGVDRDGWRLFDRKARAIEIRARDESAFRDWARGRAVL